MAMKKYLVLIIFSVLLLGSCAHEPRTLITGYGDLDLSLTVNNSIKWNTAEQPIELAGLEVADFELELVSEDGSVKKLGTYGDFLAGLKKIPVGKYTLRAYYGDLQGEGVGAVSYYGETEFTIHDSMASSVKLDCGIHNAFCTNSIEDVSTLMQDISVRLKSEYGQYIDLNSTEPKPVSLVPGKVSVEMTLTDLSGRSVTIRPFAFDVKSSEFYKVAVAVGDKTLKLSYNKETELEPVIIDIDEKLFSSSVPKFFTAKTEFSMVKGQFDENCKVTVNADGGLKNVFLTILSSPRCPCAFSQEKDILPDYSAEGAERVDLDLTKIISNLGVDITTEYSLVLQAVDMYGRVANEPCVLKVVVTPVDLFIEQPELIDIDAESVAVKVKYNGADFAKRVSFLYSGNNMDWSEASIIETYKENDYFYAVIAVNKDDERAYLRAKVNDKFSDKVVVRRLFPNFTMSCENENIWSSKADIYLTGERVESCMRFVRVLIKEENGDFHPAVIERNTGENRITLSTLMPSTKYFMMAFVDGKQAFETEFVTESAVGLPNGSFENDHEVTINLKHINCGGKYSNIQSWASLYNRTSIKVSEPKGWASVNAKTCSVYASNHNTWFQNPTTRIIDKGYDGAFAIKLQNAAWDINGVEPPKDTRTDKVYYSRNIPNIKNRSAGKIFLGSYQFNADGSEVYNDGIEFYSRPTAVTGFYRYIQDIHDSAETGLVVAQVYGFDGNKEILIGEGKGLLKPSTSFTQFKVPVTYSVRNVKAVRLKLMVSSSCYASYNQNEETLRIKTTDYPEKGISVGAELDVDLLTLLYE